MPTRLVFLLFVATALPVSAAPALSDFDRQRLVDGASDGDALLDEQDGLYVLLRNASTWPADDFVGEGGAAVAPPPDFAYLALHPGEVRGNVYLIEGWLAQADRYPTPDNAGRDRLSNTLDPAWGDRVTRWTIVTKKDDPASTVIVLLNDPRGAIAAPKPGARVKVAARFYKRWSITDAAGRPFTYSVFVGGAAEVVGGDGNAAGGGFGSGKLGGVVIAVVVVAAAFFFFRLLMSRMNLGGRARTRALIESRRRERAERGDDEEDEEEGDPLPEDPVAALDELRRRRQSG